MQYNGQDVELITEGYWPEGVRLISSDDGNHWLEKMFFFFVMGMRYLTVMNTGRVGLYVLTGRSSPPSPPRAG